MNKIIEVKIMPRAIASIISRNKIDDKKDATPNNIVAIAKIFGSINFVLMPITIATTDIIAM
jgi:hypothetical protein